MALQTSSNFGIKGLSATSDTTALAQEIDFSNLQSSTTDTPQKLNIFNSVWTQADATANVWGVCCSADGMQVMLGRSGAVADGYISINAGSTWTSYTYPDATMNRPYKFNAMSADGAIKFSVNSSKGSGQVQYTCVDNGSRWIASSDAYGSGKVDMSDSGEIIYQPQCDSRYCKRSLTLGSTFVSHTTNPSGNGNDIACSANGLIEYYFPSGTVPPQMSNNSGGTWTKMTVLPSGDVKWYGDCSANGLNVAAMDSAGSIYISSNSGGTWNARGPAQAMWAGISMSRDGQTLLAVGSNIPPYISMDAGSTWSATAGSSLFWTNCCMSANGTKMYASSTAGTYRLMQTTRPTSNYAEVVSATASVTLTTSLAAITGLTSTLPDVGTYEVEAEINEDLSAVTASEAANYSLYQLYTTAQGGAATALTNGERLGTQIPIIAAALDGTNGFTYKFKWIVTTTTQATAINVYGKQNSATTGNWTVTSAATGRSVLRWRRLA